MNEKPLASRTSAMSTAIITPNPTLIRLTAQLDLLNMEKK